MRSAVSIWPLALALVAAGIGPAGRGPVVSAAPQSGTASAPARRSADREFRIAVARRIMTAARYGTLVTNGLDGRPQARVVDPLEPGRDMDVFVATNPKSRKVKEIRRDRRVTLLYFDHDSKAYVTLIGDAFEIRDPERAGHYKADWASFFPRDDPGAWLLYRVRPRRLEVVSAADGLSGDPVTWQPDAVDFQ